MSPYPFFHLRKFSGNFGSVWRWWLVFWTEDTKQYLYFFLSEVTFMIFFLTRNLLLTTFSLPETFEILFSHPEPICFLNHFPKFPFKVCFLKKKIVWLHKTHHFPQRIFLCLCAQKIAICWIFSLVFVPFFLCAVYTSHGHKENLADKGWTAPTFSRYDKNSKLTKFFFRENPLLSLQREKISQFSEEWICEFCEW